MTNELPTQTRSIDTSSVTEKGDHVKTNPQWVLEKRLPVLSEIREHTGFLPSEHESLLHQLFFDVYRSQVIDLVSSIDSELAQSGQKCELILGIYYGIYFFNLLSNGEVLNSERNGGEADQLLDLSQWFVMLSDRKNKHVVGSGSGGINIYLSAIPNLQPDATVSYLYAKEPSDKIITKAMNHFIRAGLEEASHYLLANVRRNKALKQVPLLMRSRNPLKDLNGGLGRGTQRANESLLDYTALRGSEFAAHIIVSKFTELYDPFAWHNGFKEFNTKVRNLRREKLLK